MIREWITLVDKKEEDKTEKNKIGVSSNETISVVLDVANTLNECNNKILNSKCNNKIRNY